MADRTYNVDDLMVDTGHLAELLDAAVEAVSDTSQDALKRARALTYIARDLARHLDAKIEQNYEALRS